MGRQFLIDIGTLAQADKVLGDVMPRPAPWRGAGRHEKRWHLITAAGKILPDPE